MADSSASAPDSPGGWSPPSVEELQKLLPQFEIESLLGRGGMGAVYKARQPELHRRVAIKILPGNRTWGDEGGVHRYFERFKLEARAMANLYHPAIVAVHDFGQTEMGHPFFVMEYIDGMDIRKYIQSCGGQVPHPHAVAIVAHVLDALGYAHSKGIVHRDIKPSNILINRDGRVKVADFGLAKQFLPGNSTPAESSRQLTLTGELIGSPEFIAPETLDGAEPDARSDLYAVGVMLYQMLTGKLPRGRFAMPSKQRPGLDSRFDDIIARALESEPAERFQNASEFRSGLDALQSKPISRIDPEAESEAIPPPVVNLNFPNQESSISRLRSTSQNLPSRKPIVVSILAAATIAITAAIYFIFISQNDPGHEPPVPGLPLAIGDSAPPDNSTDSDRIGHEENSGVSPGKPEKVISPASAPGESEDTKPVDSTPGFRNDPNLAGAAAPDGMKSDEGPVENPKPTSATPADSPQPDRNSPEPAGEPALRPLSQRALLKSSEIPADALQFADSHYRFFREAITWTEAREKAETMGGHLATITSPEEQDWFLSVLPDWARCVSLGGRLSETAEWEWITGEEWNFTAWGEGRSGGREPNGAGRHARLEYSNLYYPPPGGWNDVFDDESAQINLAGRAFLVEWDRTVPLEIDDPKVAELDAQFAAAYEKAVAADHEKSMAQLRQQYLKALEEKYAELEGKTDQDTNLKALESEIGSVREGAEIPVAENSSIPVALRGLRKIYRDSVEKNRIKLEKNTEPLYDTYARALLGYETALRRSGDNTEAKAVKALRTAIENRSIGAQ